MPENSDYDPDTIYGGVDNPQPEYGTGADCPNCGASPMEDQTGEPASWCSCETLGPCGCVDYHMADCDGSRAMTKDDYLDLYAGSYPDDWPDDEGGY